MKLTWLLLLTAVVLLSACSTDIPYEPPQKVVTTTHDVNEENVVSDIPKEELIIQTKSELPTVTEFKIGETATDTQLKITVNSVDFKNIITYDPGYTTIPIEAGEGKEFVIIDLTIENILNDTTQTPNIDLQSSVTDQDGYSYEVATTASVALDKSYDNSDILPGFKKRGKVPYSVPKNTTDLKFFFKFNVFQGKTAVFDIK